jgi:uncharacterized glyoxalase superfamily protein PhnB
MSQPTPTRDCYQVHPELCVPDVRAAVEFYEQKLGFSTNFLVGEPPEMAGMGLGDISLHLIRGTSGSQGCKVYFVVGNADEMFHFHKANGVEISVEPEDRVYGMRDYAVRDLNGYVLGFGNPLFNTGEPVRIEREEVCVRLEKRMLAVLRDLAERKRMSLSSCMEETFLHTFERLGDGVASPHTAGDLRYIQELKQKHGIDYDCHASYRFVEGGAGDEAAGADDKGAGATDGAR